MLFNSYIFIFLFLPLSLVLFFLFAKISKKAAILSLVVCSLFFYAYWDIANLPIILTSLIFNFFLGKLLIRTRSKPMLILGVALNLSGIFFFKYLNLFVHSFTALSGVEIPLVDIALPLAISFFTFQQIAYLVDCYRGETLNSPWYDYVLFVTYFPQLIAGPIVHHGEILPQFKLEKTFKFNWENLSIGSSIFIVGLFKKVVIADSMALFANQLFSDTPLASISFIDSWLGSLSYTFQLYFDFSGYGDMAIGLGRMFGIHIPLNFNSPYKALNIISFWRRWHMTLSRFLRDYLYFPLGGNLGSRIFRYKNLMLTMLLGGLWHGADWTFLIWGGIHGAYLVINNLWRDLCKKLHLTDIFSSSRFYRLVCGVLTFVAVVIAWVYFRADTFHQANTILSGMFGMKGLILPVKYQGFFTHYFPEMTNLKFSESYYKINSVDFKALNKILMCGFIVFLLPNTQTFFSNVYKVSSVEKKAPFLNIRWKPNLIYLCAFMFIFLYLSIKMHNVSEFIYFQF